MVGIKCMVKKRREPAQIVIRGRCGRSSWVLVVKPVL